MEHYGRVNASNYDLFWFSLECKQSPKTIIDFIVNFSYSVLQKIQICSYSYPKKNKSDEEISKESRDCNGSLSTRPSMQVWGLLYKVIYYLSMPCEYNIFRLFQGVRFCNLYRALDRWVLLIT